MFVVCIISYLSLLAFLHFRCKHRLVFLLGILPATPPMVLVGRLQGHQLETTLHRCFIPLIPKHLGVVEQQKVSLPATPCSQLEDP